MKTAIILIIIMAGLAGVGSAVGWYLLHGHSADAEAVVVRVEPAARGELIEIVSAPGQVQPRQRVQISARVAARIVELPFQEGQSVRRDRGDGDPASVLVRLDDRDLRAALRSAEARRAAEEAQMKVAQARIAAQEAQIEASRVSLADARRELQRQRQLLASRDVSQAAVDQAQTRVDELTARLNSAEQALRADVAQLEVMKHNLEAADAEIARARDALSYTTITSPIDGVITRINAKVGELVVTGTMNNPGTVIMEVADLSQMLMVARVDEMSVAQLEVGQRARVHMQAYAGEVFDGVVETIALAPTEERDGSRYYKTEVRIDTRGRRIFTGLSGDVDIETRRHRDVIRVPSQAVLGRATDELPADIRLRPEVDLARTMSTVVYRLIDGRAVVTPVSIGASDVTHTVIRSGLAEGDAVIVGPYKVLESIRHEQRVRAEAPPATRPAIAAR